MRNAAIHGAADRRDAAGSGRPVGEIAGLGDLVGAEHGKVEVPTPDHGEGIGVMEEGGTGLERDRFLPGIDQVPVLFAGLRRLAKAQNTVLRVVDHFAALGLEAGDHLGKTDAEVDVEAGLQILRGAPCDLGVGELDLVELLGHATASG